MAFKIIPFFNFLTITLVASQYNADYHHFKHGSPNPVFMKNYDAPIYNEPKTPGSYDFSYSVHDDHTKDIKNQIELRKNGMVKGHYDMIDSDGYKRIVDYTADDKTGFQASVQREKTDIRVPTPSGTYNKKLYYNSGYPEHSPVHHQIALQVHTATPKNSNHHTSYTEQVKPNHLKPHHMDLSGHSVKFGKPSGLKTYPEHSKPQHMGLSQYKVELKKPSGYTNYAEHSVKPHHMGLSGHSVKLGKPSGPTNYVEHSVKPHHMSLSLYSAEPKTSNRYTEVYAEHTFKDHHMQMPLHYAEPHKPAILYSNSRKSVAVNNINHKSIGKHTSQEQHIATNYFIPGEHKERIPIKTPVLYKAAKPLTNLQAKTHVSFHGVNANYEY